MNDPRPRRPPLVGGSPLLGSARDLRRDQLGSYDRAMRAHGDVAGFRVGPPRLGFEFTAVFRPEAARLVLATNSGHYRKDAPVFTEIAGLIGDGLLTSEGDRWRRDRRMLQPLFTRRRVASYVPTIASAAADLVAAWQAEAAGGRTVDLYEAAVGYALDALGRTVLGEDVAGARPLLLAALPELNQRALRRGLAPVRLPASWPTPANRRAQHTQQAVYALVDGLIARRRSAPSAADDLLGLLLAARDPEGGGGLDDEELRTHTLTFILAGHETTASSLAFVLQLVAGDDAVQEWVRAEVADVLGDRAVVAEDLDRLRYTTQVVHEALRLYPPAHTVVRAAVQDTSVLGYDLPKGRIVAVSIWGIHHNPAVWDDPHGFDPDRFHVDQPATGRAAHQAGYAHLPFGGGPRACIGEHLAMAELVVALGTLVRAFRLRAVAERPDVEAAVTLRPRGALPCRLEAVRPLR